MNAFRALYHALILSAYWYEEKSKHFFFLRSGIFDYVNSTDENQSELFYAKIIDDSVHVNLKHSKNVDVLPLC